MIALAPDECRVLGVLVEKALTTPGQYPLSLNAITVGCGQKNNRNPVSDMSEDRVLDAIDGLRAKGLVREAMMTGSRVSKYRHTARETLAVSIEQLVVLVELLLRGPQTLGELRQNASRMHPIESLEACEATVGSLAAHESGPMVRELPPRPGTRAKRFAQMLCPTLHPLDDPQPSHHQPSAPAAGTVTGSDREGERSASDRLGVLESLVHELRAEVQRLSDRVRQLGG